jgi:hypothetical protein
MTNLEFFNKLLSFKFSFSFSPKETHLNPIWACCQHDMITVTALAAAMNQTEKLWIDGNKSVKD